VAAFAGMRLAVKACQDQPLSEDGGNDCMEKALGDELGAFLLPVALG
jgi:hypothetical protein